MPELEEREAARFCGYTWKKWCELLRAERVDGVAHMRLAHLIDMFKDEAVGTETERRMKKK